MGRAYRMGLATVAATAGVLVGCMSPTDDVASIEAAQSVDTEFDEDVRSRERERREREEERDETRRPPSEQEEPQEDALDEAGPGYGERPGYEGYGRMGYRAPRHIGAYGPAYGDPNGVYPNGAYPNGAYPNGGYAGVPGYGVGVPGYAVGGPAGYAVRGCDPFGNCFSREEWASGGIGGYSYGRSSSYGMRFGALCTIWGCTYY